MSSGGVATTTNAHATAVDGDDTTSPIVQCAVPSPPGDGISKTIFHPLKNVLAVSSWDKTLRVYQVTEEGDNSTLSATPLATFTANAPILDCCFLPTDDNRLRILAGGLDKTVRVYDVDNQTEHVIGEHDQAVSCVAAGKEPDSLFSAGWDSTLRQWNINAGESRQEVNKCGLPDRAYTMSFHEGSRCLIVGTAKRFIRIFDSSNISAPSQERVSTLKHQTRCIRLFSDGAGYAVSSIEGRVGIEFIDPEVSQKSRYAFKCHRSENNGVTTVYPVNTLAFHPVYGTFATGGCDGSVVMWDATNKRKVSNIGDYETSIASLSFNHDGSLFAIASSYTFEKGDQEHPHDQIYIRKTRAAEVQPRKKQA